MAAGTDATTQMNATTDDSTQTGGVRLHRLYSRVQESLCALLDGFVKRVFTLPYQDADASEHVKAIGSLAMQHGGGLPKIFLTTFHHAGGKGWKSSDGVTVGYSTHPLRNTEIPKGNEDAIKVLSATQSYISGIEKLIPGDPSVKTAQSQLDLVKQHDGTGMNLLDFGVAIQQILANPTQAVARAHAGIKPTGHSPKPMPPHEPDEQTAQPAAPAQPQPTQQVATAAPQPTQQ